MNPNDWSEPRRWTTLTGAAVHVWLVEIEAWRGELDHCWELLSSEEQQRANLFRVKPRREQSILAQALRRRLLARYSDFPAKHLQFRLGEHGKPSLEDSPIQFNISHTEQFLVFAFTLAGSVGVDIERVRAGMPRQIEIAERHFCAGELKQLRGLPDAERSDAFTRCWTRKEAFLKARGVGVFGGLNSFEVTLDRADARLVRNEGALQQPWWMAGLPDVNDHVGAVVVQTNECKLFCWRAKPDF